MAEAALSGLAGKLLGELGSITIKKAFERFQSIRKAKEDLDELSCTIQIIQLVLLDAEKKQEESETGPVRLWIQRVKDVLYDADDLFDDVATDALIEQLQQDKKKKLLAKVRAPFSMFSAISSDDNIAKRVKAIRKRLDKIHSDMAPFNFVRSTCENAGLRRRAESRPFVDEKVVVGRDDDKKAILQFLFAKSEDVEQSTVSVIAIVGIGGMGKTTLAQLIYNNQQVKRNFEKRWWACISDIVGETNVLERIARSMDKDFRQDSDPKELISKSIVRGGKYLLVLDDVWDNDLGIWFSIMSLLSRGAKGSKIIVTTRFQSVPRVVQKNKCTVHTLNGLAKNESWELFKKIAFTEEQEDDPRWNILGMEIMQKCANVPLALKSIASVLLEKNSIQEWESFKDKELSKINPRGDSIMPTLKLSYDHLSSNLKQCFVYCSLFPQDYVFHKEELITQWIAQGYVNPNDKETVEEVGHAYFMDLFRKSFFQEAETDEYGEIYRCKMHDLIHDLAKDVDGKESLALTTGWHQFHKNTRHLLVSKYADISENIPVLLFDENRLRTLHNEGRVGESVDLPWPKFKVLRALHLRSLWIENFPSSIVDLKHLRYLNLCQNQFTSLPESLTGLVNLITLDISNCYKLEALPNSIGKLINLRHLYTHDCDKLRDMPLGLWELTSLQRLSYLKVGGKTGCGSRLDLLAGLRLKGKLVIKFNEYIWDWDENECRQLSSTLQELTIDGYPGKRIPRLDPINLKRLCLGGSLFSKIKHLPPLRFLPYLKYLQLDNFDVEYVVEEEDDSENEEGMKSDPSPVPSSTLFYPRLEEITLDSLTNLKGWSRKEEPYSFFPLLSRLYIWNCPVLKSMPLCPCLRTLDVSYLETNEIIEELMQQLLPRSSHFSTTAPSTMQTIQVSYCPIVSFSGETLTSLRSLKFRHCYKLKKLCLAPRHLSVLKVLEIERCEGLKLWEEDVHKSLTFRDCYDFKKLFLTPRRHLNLIGELELRECDGLKLREEDVVHKRGVDWDSLPHLRYLEIVRMGELPETLPPSLQELQSLGQLEIKCNPCTYALAGVS